VLVVPDKKALIVKSRNPEQLLTLIPTAKSLFVKGQQLVAVPHRLDETRVLTNLGMVAPSPIRYYYKWSGLYTPFKAQKDTAEFLTLHPRAYVLNDMGTGKTLAALWAYDFLRSLGKVHKLLVVCPLSTMERTWADEIFRHFPHLTSAVLYGSKERRLKMLEQDVDVYIVNHDGVRIVLDALEKRPDIDIIIPDEIGQSARNAQTDRWKFLNLIVNKHIGGTRWCWGMTGTPTPNAPTDAWAQCRLVTPSTVPPYYGRFKNQVMRQVNNFLWVPRPDATDVVHQVMQPAIRFSRAECMDLPPCLFQNRTVEMSSTQKTAYRDMLGKLKAMVAGGEVLAVNEANKISKLLQIACGVAYTSDGEEVTTDAGPRLEVAREIIEEAEGKAIVFVPFISSVHYVADYLRKSGLSVECVYGEVSKNERDRIFSAFQREGEPRVIVAQPVAMSHGLTLTAANTIIWYAPTFSNDTYDQACARITRAGQTLAQLIVNIEGSPVEQLMYQRLRNKQKMQGLLLSMVEEGRVDIVTA
jgi:SNF2 family DNA or RNA helicase